MSKRKQGLPKVSKVISYIIILLLMVAIVGGLAFFTNGFTEGFKTFYAIVGDKTVMSSSGGYVLSSKEPLTVDVKYTFGFLSKEVTGYTVKVVPNADNSNFDFTVDGIAYSFAAETDLTAGFDFERSENSFVITPKGSLYHVLSAVYPESEVDFDRSAIDFSKDLFTAVVTSYDGSTSVYINFGIKDFEITNIVLSQTEIIF